jgi:aminomethyltransferase
VSQLITVPTLINPETLLYVMPKTTQLYGYHVKNGKLTEFSGFEMPLWYSSISEEHLAVRNSGGLFDVSHMGRAMIKGKEASQFLSKLLPTNCKKIENGRCFYSVICNESGGIVDDVVTSKFSPTEYLMIVNAGNREKDFSWLRDNSRSFDAAIEDLSDQSALIAFQGPKSTSILQRVVDKDLSKVKRFSFISCSVFGEECLVSRTGYTGEDGYEIMILNSPLADQKPLMIWNGLLDLGKSEDIRPCGLGARDTLRLEAGMCLYGQDIDQRTTPLEASLENIVDFDSHEFIGKEALGGQIKDGVQKKRVSFSMIEPGIPRHGHEVVFSDKQVGVVTSGTHSPLLKQGIGMAYVPPELTSPGQKLAIRIRDLDKFSEVRKPPLYDTTKYGYKRKM